MKIEGEAKGESRKWCRRGERGRKEGGEEGRRGGRIQVKGKGRRNEGWRRKEKWSRGTGSR